MARVNDVARYILERQGGHVSSMKLGVRHVRMWQMGILLLTKLVKKSCKISTAPCSRLLLSSGG